MHISNDWASVQRWYDFCFVFEYKVISLKLIGCTTSKPSKSGTIQMNTKKEVEKKPHTWKSERMNERQIKREESERRTEGGRTKDRNKIEATTKRRYSAEVVGKPNVYINNNSHNENTYIWNNTSLTIRSTFVILLASKTKE